MKPHELIKLLCDATGKSTLQLAKDMHRASFQGTLHKLIHGNVPMPTQPTAKRIADFFGLPIEALYDDRIATRIAAERGLVASRVAAAVIAERPTPPGPPRNDAANHGKDTPLSARAASLGARLDALSEDRRARAYALLDGTMRAMEEEERLASSSSSTSRRSREA